VALDRCGLPPGPAPLDPLLELPIGVDAPFALPAGTCALIRRSSLVVTRASRSGSTGHRLSTMPSATLQQRWPAPGRPRPRAVFSTCRLTPTQC
jgi:hypothetical protein